MRVTFPRLPDHQRAYAVVERDDGVVYRLYGGLAGPRLPHDIRHLVVERELRIGYGIWAGIAAGVVFKSMYYVSGRRPPHAAERSAKLLRAFREQGLRAEVLANLVESVAALDQPSAEEIRRLAASHLSVLSDANVDPKVIAAAAAALQVEASRWARLRVGEELCYDWPPRPHARAGDKHHRTFGTMKDRNGGGQKVGNGEMLSRRPPDLIEHGPVTLRRYRPDDLDALYLAVTESADHLRPWAAWSLGYSRESAAQFLAASARGWRDGVVFGYGIFSTGALAGSCSLMARIGAGGLEIGYWVHQAYTRRGLATAAAAALVDEAFRLPGVGRVEIVVDELNVASAGVPRKLGFKVVGRRPLDTPPPAGTGIGVVWRLVR
jgi:RimJ/RimL family protein N-acetyltransferase